jgi:hypothetical protein
MAYPNTVDSFTPVVDDVDTLVASDINTLQTAIAAIETELGTVPKGTYADVKARLDGMETNAQRVTLVAGETLAQYDYVFISSGAGGLTAGRAYKADSDASGRDRNAFQYGFVVTSGSTVAGSSVYVQMAGTLDVSSRYTLNAGALQYASTTAGSITETAPSQKIVAAIAISTTTLLINRNDYNVKIIYDELLALMIGLSL